MFEKMEASERRRQHLCSEGSVDSDTMSSPSTLLPPPLLSNKQQKERRSSSTSLRKVPILSGGKVYVCVCAYICVCVHALLKLGRYSSTTMC